LRCARQPDSQRTFEIVRYRLIRIRRTFSKAEGFHGLDEASGSSLWDLPHPKLEARKIEMQSSPSAMREGIDDARRRPFSLRHKRLWLKFFYCGISKMRAKEIASKRSEAAAKLGPVTGEAEGQALFEMANLRPERTGLPFVVFISQRGGARHDARVKVAHSAKVRPSEMATVAIRPSVRVVRGVLDPRDLNPLTRWIELNKDVLIDYWNGVIEYTEDAINAIRPIGLDAP